MTRYTSCRLASHYHPLHQPIANHFRQFLSKSECKCCVFLFGPPFLDRRYHTFPFNRLLRLSISLPTLQSIFPYYYTRSCSSSFKVTQYSVMQTSHTLFINISVLSSMQICVILDSHQQCMDMPVFLQESLQFPDSHLFQTRPAGITGTQKQETKLKRCWGFVKIFLLGTDRISCQFRVDSG